MPRRAPARASDPGARSTARELLVVDDVPEVCEEFERLVPFFRAPGIHLTVETEAERGLNRVRHNPYDLVVSDFRMDGADGLALLTTARRTNPTGRRILMTGYSDLPGAESRVQDAGLTAFLRKPFDGVELVGVLCDVLDDVPLTLDTLEGAVRALEAETEAPRHVPSPLPAMDLLGDPSRRRTSARRTHTLDFLRPRRVEIPVRVSRPSAEGSDPRSG